ncbi:MAG: transcriptional repressor [Synergistaceae bacterium]|nr:transcriptional repressor [Synergistaceae bacterium]
MLKAASLKVTPLRIKVLDRLMIGAQPLSHAEIQVMLPDIDRVTLYRTLSTFVDADIAHQVQGLDGMWRFCAHVRDGSGCPGNHAHFLCLSCGIMVCLTDQAMPRINVPEGCIVSGKQMVVYGKCRNCSEEEKRGVGL